MRAGDKSMPPDNRTPLERLVAPPQVYRHHQGAHYSVVAVGRHSETLEWMVVYRLTDGGPCWVRPLTMFVETLPDGRLRFERRR